MTAAMIRRNVILVLAGVAVLLLKGGYHGPLAEVVHSYGGNFSVSFAVYFLAEITAARYGLGKAVSAVAALLAVEAFEVTDGFGFMSNTFDPLDLVANAAGIVVALALDTLLHRSRAGA